jgi:hypothetical protein
VNNQVGISRFFFDFFFLASLRLGASIFFSKDKDMGNDMTNDR